MSYKLMVNFLKNQRIVFKLLEVLASMCERLSSSTYFSTLGVVNFYNITLSNRSEEVSHGGFNLHFPDD